MSASAASVLAAEDEEKKQDVAAWVASEEKPISKHAATIVQVSGGAIKIPPSGWKCTDCDKTENLWLNLTDGHIGCGRKFFDGSGGNGHAMVHFQETQHPLCVKLGTITPALDAVDVYCYAEDCLVVDPLLQAHLEHFGIDVAGTAKSEKTMSELELDANISLDWSRLTEAGKVLQVGRFSSPFHYYWFCLLAWRVRACAMCVRWARRRARPSL